VTEVSGRDIVNAAGAAGATGVGSPDIANAEIYIVGPTFRLAFPFVSSILVPLTRPNANHGAAF
jgi:hypothetical protein